MEIDILKAGIASLFLRYRLTVTELSIEIPAIFPYFFVLI